MKIGFTINLGNYESMRVDSSEHYKWEDAMAEIFGFLSNVREDHVQQFAKRMLKVRVKEDDAEELSKE